MPCANEVVLERPDRRRGPAADAGLLVDVLDVVPDGLGRDAETLGDRLVGLAAHEHEEDLELALGQPGRQLARSLPHAVAGGSEHRVDGFRVEPPLFGLAHQLRLGRRRVESRPVGPCLAHRGVAVRGGEDAG